MSWLVVDRLNDMKVVGEHEDYEDAHAQALELGDRYAVREKTGDDSPLVSKP